MKNALIVVLLVAFASITQAQTPYYAGPHSPNGTLVQITDSLIVPDSLAREYMYDVLVNPDTVKFVFSKSGIAREFVIESETKPRKHSKQDFDKWLEKRKGQR